RVGVAPPVSAGPVPTGPEAGAMGTAAVGRADEAGPPNLPGEPDARLPGGVVVAAVESETDPAPDLFDFPCDALAEADLGQPLFEPGMGGRQMHPGRDVSGGVEQQ